jgi:DNA-binding response OmpR family regulator
MKVVVTTRDSASQIQFTDSLSKFGFEAVFAMDGAQAWTILDRPDGPRLAVVEWFLPDMTGLDLCRRIRAKSRKPYISILLSIPKGVAVKVSDGLDAGADDYIVEPFEEHELLVRLRAGQRITEMQGDLVRRSENRSK